ncbi:MAG: ABC transporter ATP-binding protein [Dehalococcoidia bacterium]|nr:ABC transporter ATP-binding protein [Dehalococcoidia bacterium]
MSHDIISPLASVSFPTFFTVQNEGTELLFRQAISLKELQETLTAMWGHSISDKQRPRPTRPVWPTLRGAIGLLRPYRLIVLIYIFTIILSSLAGLGQPLLIRELIDRALPQKDGDLLNLLVLGIVVLVILAALNSTLQSYLSNLAAHGVMFDLRSRIYRHLTGMSLRWFTANRTGESISRVSNDVGGIQGVITDTMGGVVGDVITLVSTLVVMFGMDWRLALFSIICVPIFIIPAKRVGGMQRQLVGETQEQMAGMNSQMQESLSVSGALLMKTFGRQDDEIDTFYQTARKVRDLNIRRALIGRWFRTSINLFGSITPAVVYWYGGHQIIGGEASLGTVVAEAALLGRLFGPISSLLGVHISVLSSVALFERIFDYLDLAHEIKDAPHATKLRNVRGGISFDDVSFSYVKGHPTLHNLSFEVPAGKFAALVGPTGAGKTTIAYLIPRLYDVDNGRVLVDCQDVREVTQASLAEAIGMVNQEPFLFHTSIRGNLRYARPDATDHEVEAAARAADIHGFIVRLPHGYETIVGERGYRLSGGEKQRVAIARAILKDPAILILDEATSSVDTATERIIQQAIERLSHGRTVIAIAHRLSTILSADVILVIDHGRLVDSGRHEELLARGGLYADLYEKQFGARPAAGCGAGIAL